MQRYFLELAYDGTNFFGWQVQPNQRTVQAEIETALSKLYSNEKVGVTGCGRTDTGVHASQYFLHFDAIERYGVEDLKHKLNGMLPTDIAVYRVIPIEKEIHARFDADKRTYTYYISQEKNPFTIKNSWYKRLNLDLNKMNEASKMCIGKKDFECFSKVHTEVNNFLCEVFECEWRFENNQYIFKVSANRFLRNMVRAMVGTFIEVGLGKINLEQFDKILKSKDRSEAGSSVPAQGLFLSEVKYDGLNNV
ncbi:MAG: tRNA pseudouridine(38-40) synthase TruA [Crocinitomicaceae bacterium]|nr:tRNA pseudouridine(38-40) synthase TruA [Crocinitomicaceae bacterium]